jgi:hypothetical protein
MLAPLLAVIAGVVVVVVLFVARPAHASPPPPLPEKSPTPTGGGGGGGLPVPPVLPDPLLAGAVAWSALNFGIGKKLTGSDVGGLAGLIGGGGFLSAGNVGNVGVAVGAGTDQLLGGTGGGITGSIAQAGGFLVGFAGGLFGALAGIGLFTVVLPIYALASAITDALALAHGQKGAAEDYAKKWGDVELRIRQALPGVFPDGAPASGKPWGTGSGQCPLERYSWPLADGYMRHSNRLDYRKWMHRTWGIGKGEADQAKWGADRGHYVGSYPGPGADGMIGPPAGQPPARHWFSQGYAIIRLADPAGTSTALVDFTYGWSWRYVWAGFQTPPSWVTEEMLSGEILINESGQVPERLKDGKGDAINASDYYALTWTPLTRKETVTRDSLADDLMKIGEAIANKEAWIAHLKTPWGPSIFSALDHAKWGAEHGNYIGLVTLGPDGTTPVLDYEGKRFLPTGATVKTA